MAEVVYSYVYIICHKKDAGPVKIGFSKHPEKRLKQLQTGQPTKLIIFHTEKIEESRVKLIEKLVHKDMRYAKMSGEWFNITPDNAFASIKHILMQTEDIKNLGERIAGNTIKFI